MAHFYRLILSIFLLVPGFSFADTVPFTSSSGSGYAVNGWQTGQTSKQAAADAFCSPSRNAAWVRGEVTDGNGVVTSSGNYVRCLRTNGQYDAWYPITTYSGTFNSCPANSTSNGSSCTCSSGFIGSGGQCIQDPCVNTKDIVNPNYSVVSSNGLCDASVIGVNGLSGMCSANFTASSLVKYDGVTYCVGKLTYTGATYSGPQVQTYTPTGAQSTANQQSATAAANDAAAKEYAANLASGKCPGTVNGLQVWVACSTVEAKKTTTTTVKDAAGNVTSTGTATVTDSTSCTGLTCTTLKTTANPDGTSSVVTLSASKATFCAENPTASVCKTTSFAAGDCNTPPVCDGDAIQCALAKQQKETLCALTKTSTESALYDSKKSLTGNQTGDNPNNETVSLTSGSFDTSSALGSGSCIADKVVTVWGKSVSLPFSQVCSWLAVMGNILVSVSLLAAARIVVGA